MRITRAKFELHLTISHSVTIPFESSSGRKRQWASEAKQDRILSSYASEQIRETVYRETGRSTFIIQSL